MKDEIQTTTYNGWVNFETWNVYTWFTNDEGTYNLIHELITGTSNKYEAIDALKDYVADKNPIEDNASLYSDILTHSISRIAWQDIVNAFLDE